MAWTSRHMLIHAVISAVAEGLVAGHRGRTAADAADFSVRFDNAFSAALGDRGVPPEITSLCYGIINDKTTEPVDGPTVRMVKGTLPDREDPDVR